MVHSPFIGLEEVVLEPTLHLACHTMTQHKKYMCQQKNAHPKLEWANWTIKFPQCNSLTTGQDLNCRARLTLVALACMVKNPLVDKALNIQCFVTHKQHAAARHGGRGGKFQAARVHVTTPILVSK